MILGYEVTMAPDPLAPGWMVWMSSGGQTVGKTRHFRTFYFAKRYYDKRQRQLKG